MSTVVLMAWSPSGEGKPFVARINGRDSKFTFNREFLGHHVRVDDPGLYQVRDIDKKGYITDRYVLVWRDGERLAETSLSEEDAMSFARQLESFRSDSERKSRITALGRANTIAWHEKLIALSEAKSEPDGMCYLKSSVGPLASGTSVRRADLIAARRGEIARLSGAAPVDRAALNAEKSKLLARLAEIETLLAAKPKSPRTDGSTKDKPKGSTKDGSTKGKPKGPIKRPTRKAAR